MIDTNEQENEEQADTDISQAQKKGCGQMSRCSTTCMLYCSYLLSSSGDRMWTFAVALAMVKISNDLRLTAVAMLVNGIAVLFFQPIIGRWIDRTQRFKAASVLLFANNFCVACSAGVLVLLLYLDDIIAQSLRYFLIMASIVFGALSLLASEGSSIAITKDWVVEMASGDKHKLAELNACLRRINLKAVIVAPLIVGQLMTSLSLVAGCIFIAAWNICSFAVERQLLWLIYRQTPQLVRPKHSGNAQMEQELKELNSAISGSEQNSDQADVTDVPLSGTRKIDSQSATKSDSNSSFGRILYDFVNAWKSYREQEVFFAALSLALLYFTVLGLDGITTGYAFSQDIPENILALARGVGAVVGISGTFAFPILCRRIGLQNTGLVALALQCSCLTLCLVSIWLPGSPFVPTALIDQFSGRGKSSQTGFENWSEHVLNTTIVDSGLLTPLELRATNDNRTTLDNVGSNGTQPSSVCSIWTFMAGVTFARFGLWMIDLTVTQLMQESIAGDQRGLINGIQSSLQNAMDMLKSLLTIALPRPETFGFLVIISFTAVCTGFLSYIFYWRRHQRRGNVTRNELMKNERAGT